jgi:tetratricopeptide (TPR) repeat protein
MMTRCSGADGNNEKSGVIERSASYRRGNSCFAFRVDFFGDTRLNSGMAEKSINEISRDVRMLFQKGNDAFSRENFDYAINLYNQVLEKEPGFVECRKALRTAQARKAEGKGGGIFKKMWSSAGSSPMVAKAQFELRKNPAEALLTAEHILNGDPNNSQAHKIVVEAATALELPRTAVLSLEILTNHSPKDKELAVQFANALAGTGEGARAEKFLADFSSTRPYDNELSQALKDLSATKTLGEKGYQSIATGQGSYRDILKDKEAAVSLEQEKRVQKTEDNVGKLIIEYEAELKKEPNNLKRLRSLAELYTQKKQFDLALSYYNKIKTATEGGSDSALDRAIAETTLRKFDHQLSQLDQNAPDYAEKSAGIAAERQEYQLAEAQQRAEKFPTDLQIRFELGQLYFQAGKISEAIQEFQKAQSNPHRRIAAMSYLGQCFAKRGMNDLAARTIQNAIKEKQVYDDEKKELIYVLGCVLEKMGKKEEAIEQFKLIYETDIGYKDVAAKVDAYYAGQ